MEQNQPNQRIACRRSVYGLDGAGKGDDNDGGCPMEEWNMKSKVTLKEIVGTKIIYAALLVSYYWMWARRLACTNSANSLCFNPAFSRNSLTFVFRAISDSLTVRHAEDHKSVLRGRSDPFAVHHTKYDESYHSQRQNQPNQRLLLNVGQKGLA